MAGASQKLELRFGGDWARNLYAVTLSPDRSRLAAGSQVGDVQVWEVDHPELPPRELSGHRGPILLLSFSPDGELLAAGGEHGTVHLWTLAAPEHLPQALEGQQDSLSSLVFSPDRRSLASVDGEGTVRLWRVYKRDLVDFARTRVQPQGIGRRGAIPTAS